MFAVIHVFLVFVVIHGTVALYCVFEEPLGAAGLWAAGLKKICHLPVVPDLKKKEFF